MVAPPPKNLKSQSQKISLRFRLSWWYPALNTRSARSKSAVTATVHQPEGCIVAVPSLWPRLGGVLQQHGLGVIRQVGVTCRHRMLADLSGVISHVPVSGQLQLGWFSSARVLTKLEQGHKLNFLNTIGIRR